MVGDTKILNERGSLPIIVGMILVIAFVAGVGFTYFSGDRNEQAMPISNIMDNNQPAPISSATNAVSEYKNLPEDIKVINGDLKLSYFFNPHDNQKIVYKQIDFKTNTSKETALHYLSQYNSDESKRGRYIVSPNNKFVLKMTRNRLEIAELSNPVFRTIHKVEIVRDPEWEVVEEDSELFNNYAHMDDAMWDENGNLYFITGVGLDGVGAPPGGVYSKIYAANEDGSNVRLINDPTKENQKIGFMKDFAYIDESKNDIYLSGRSHGGHLAAMIVVDANSGDVKRTFQDIYTDFVNPVFNKDFSKSYYVQDNEDKGYLTPVKIYEYDMTTKNKKVIYTVPNGTANNLLEGELYLNQNLNRLYFQVRDEKNVHFYALDLNAGGQPKLLFDDNGNCSRTGVSLKGDYLFITCRQPGNIIEYQFYEVSSGKRSTFFNEKYDNSSVDSETFQFVRFE